MTPFHQRADCVRMRHGNRTDASARLDRFHRGLIQQADAVPEHIAVGGLNEQCALTDGEARHRTDAGNVRVHVLDAVVKIPLHLGDGGPALPLEADVLSLVFADRAVLRRRVSFRMLHTAGHTDKVWHGYLLVWAALYE